MSCPGWNRASWRLVLVGIVCAQSLVFLLSVGLMPRQGGPEGTPQDGLRTVIGRSEPVPVRSPQDPFPGPAKSDRAAPVSSAKAAESSHTEPVAMEEPWKLDALREHVNNQNANLKILNLKEYGPVLPHHLVVIVQVHKRLRELELFLTGLRNVRNVSSILLVVSMDYATRSLEDLVANISFCKVLPIYFPHSGQLHPNTFPGTDPRDCEPKMSRSTAVAAGCLNAGHPDTYGNYREAAITATKHHWWWKCTFVFERIPALGNHTGLKLFVEEDHFLAPDFLHVLDLMQKRDGAVNFYVMGRQRKMFGKRGGNNVRFSKISSGALGAFETGDWWSATHNMGFAFNDATWLQLKACSKEFCKYDDYNWDWTLYHLGHSCTSKPLTYIGALAPRVYHFGMCGVHFKMNNCNPADALKEYLDFLNENQAGMFPSRIGDVLRSTRPRKNPKPFGGWGDPRDVELCDSFTKVP